MDERIEKAFEVANYMATLSNQKRIILEEYNQKLIYFVDGATFKITQDLISFVSTMADRPFDLVLVDSNNLPVKISDPKKFLSDIITVYSNASEEYFEKYSSIKSKRKIADMIAL
jgi:hypothetical protein